MELAALQKVETWDCNPMLHCKGNWQYFQFHSLKAFLLYSYMKHYLFKNQDHLNRWDLLMKKDELLRARLLTHLFHFDLVTSSFSFYISKRTLILYITNASCSLSFFSLILHSVVHPLFAIMLRHCKELIRFTKYPCINLMGRKSWKCS